jgi:hypothetical protein
MLNLNRRELLRAAGAVTAAFATGDLCSRTGSTFAAKQNQKSNSDSLPMQLYKSLSDEQRQKVCLPIDHERRQFVSNWWYIHPDYRVNNAFNEDQQELIQKIFDSLHNPDYQQAVSKQVQIDQYGKPKNAPAVGFFGTPDSEDFEFIYTGHHVTRRCNAHTDQGQGFGGAPIFYGHFLDEFNETKDHLGNPYWYQGKIFNQFVQALDFKQQAQGLVSDNPRSETPATVVKKKESGFSGLSCVNLSEDQKQLLIQTMENMLAMFRQDDVTATLQTIKSKQMIDQLHVSWYDGKFDLGSDKVWDTWQIEGPEMVWYFRGQPHIHSYFHLKS